MRHCASVHGDVMRNFAGARCDAHHANTHRRPVCGSQIKRTFDRRTTLRGVHSPYKLSTIVATPHLAAKTPPPSKSVLAAKGHALKASTRTACRMATMWRVVVARQRQKKAVLSCAVLLGFGYGSSSAASLYARLFENQTALGGANRGSARQRQQLANITKSTGIPSSGSTGRWWRSKGGGPSIRHPGVSSTGSHGDSTVGVSGGAMVTSCQRMFRRQHSHTARCGALLYRNRAAAVASGLARAGCVAAAAADDVHGSRGAATVSLDSELVRGACVWFSDSAALRLRRRAYLAWPASDGAPRRVLVVKKPRDAAASDALARIATHLTRRGLTVCVEPGIAAQARAAAPQADFQEWDAENSPPTDLCITLGGDGTVLYLASLFTRDEPLPPTLCFAMGTLGFLTPFDIATAEATLDRVLAASLDNPVACTLRTRKRCEMLRPDDTLACICVDEGSEYGSEVDVGTLEDSELSGTDEEQEDGHKGWRYDQPSGNHAVGADFDSNSRSSTTASSSSSNGRNGGQCALVHHVLNECVLDRGSFPGVLALEVYVDGEYLTAAELDGLIIATPSGSTAYSMSSGGSMVAPSVPCTLITPNAPLSLSFRPLIIPESSDVLVRVAPDGRCPHARVSFDGRHTARVPRGFALRCTTSLHPLPLINLRGQDADWYQGITHKLKWNQPTRAPPPLEPREVSATPRTTPTA